MGLRCKENKMFEALYNFSIIFAWMIVLFHGLIILLVAWQKHNIDFNRFLYTFLVALAWLIANH